MGSIQPFLSILFLGLFYLLTGIGKSNSPYLTENVEYQTCRERDSLALVALYNSTDGANWTNTWDLSQPMDNWYGITLNEEGCVKDLRLCVDCVCFPCDGNNLVGALPDEIGELVELEYLAIANNPNLTGSIPNTIGQLKKLRSLFMEANNISGQIPLEIGGMASLEDFRFGENSINGTIPSTISSASNLRRIFGEGNNLTGSLPTELFSLDLLFLWLSRSSISGTIPNEIGNLANLKSLRLSESKLVGEIPAEVGNLDNLQDIYLYDNELSGEIPPQLGNLTNLERLYLHNNQLEGCFPEEITRFCALGFSENPWETGYNFSGNVQLSWQGNFSRLCNGENQIGVSCDDGDVGTTNDIIQEDCKCKGIEPLVEDLSHNVTVNTTCPEERDGSFELTLNGGVPPYLLLWSSVDNAQIGEAIIGEGENLLVESLATGLYTVTISDDLSNTTAVDVTIGDKTEGCKEKGIAPQVITPNGDGLNETFEFDELNDNPQDYLNNELIIVNRWGDVVYQAKPYRNDWNGTNIDGKELPVATYYYVLKLDIGEGEIKQGYITIIR